jgi:hypothetical protein
MLSLCIKLWWVCSANASNSDAYAQNVLKGPFQIWNFYVYAQRTHQILTCMLSISSNFDAYTQRNASNSMFRMFWRDHFKFGIFMCMLSVCISSAQIERIRYRRRVSHAARRKANGRTKEKVSEGGSRDQGRWKHVFAHVPPSFDLIRVPQQPPLLPHPQLLQFSETAEDLCEGL